MCVYYVMSNFATLWILAYWWLFCRWHFPGKDTRVGCHFLTQLLNHWQVRFFYHWGNWEAQEKEVHRKANLPILILGQVLMG